MTKGFPCVCSRVGILSCWRWWSWPSSAYKRLPDAARSLGRSMRIFKSEIDEMKKDEPAKPSAASSDTVRGETVRPASDPIQDPTKNPVADPNESDKHNQPPA